MPFLSETNAVQLTSAGWTEIFAALESKIAAIERGFYDDGHPWPGLASNDAWMLPPGRDPRENRSGWRPRGRGGRRARARRRPLMTGSALTT